ncbi:sulfurtransferase [Kibdelosporangium philippinense]|uniref:sulfurtransferase n=1 Tax=Kibdelosporangium philippinense TaxID=211113 RepID=UPI0027DFDC9D|nr:rhodanese-like domain-containing protein [Kibdelosporangium philippinense]
MRALVSTSELADLLNDSRPPVLLDVRWMPGGPSGRVSYVAGHLPGAVFLDLDADLAALPGKCGRHPLPKPEDLEEVLRAAGVNSDSAVVVYDGGNGSVAARAWWLLRWAGHSNVAVLDGGYAAWEQEGRPLTTEVPQPKRGDIDVTPGAMPTVDADEAADLAKNGVLLGSVSKVMGATR